MVLCALGARVAVPAVEVVSSFSLLVLIVCEMLVGGDVTVDEKCVASKDGVVSSSEGSVKEAEKRLETYHNASHLTCRTE